MFETQVSCLLSKMSFLCLFISFFVPTEVNKIKTLLSAQTSL